MTERKGLLLVPTEPSASSDQQFSDWHDTEHFRSVAYQCGA